MAQAKALEVTDAAKASALYVKAWRLYSFGRWPVRPLPASSARMGRRWRHFCACRLMDPPLEVVHIPLKGSEIVGTYGCRRCKRAGAAVIAISGLDSRKRSFRKFWRHFALWNWIHRPRFAWHWAVAHQGQRNRGREFSR